MEHYWVIEEWIPPGIAIGRKGYWGALEDGRFKNVDRALLAFKLLEKRQRRRVRLVKVTREVVG